MNTLDQKIISPKLRAYFSHIAIVVFVFAQAHAQPCHGGGGAGGGGGASSAGGSSGASGLADALSSSDANDSTPFTASLYGYLGKSFSLDGSNGTPLGTGGALPSGYNLTRTDGIPNTSSAPSPRLHYGDFGYLPLWRTNVLYGRISALTRRNNRLSLGISYGPDLSLSEMNYTWYPVFLKGSSLKFGKMTTIGSYCDIFDQALLENFSLTGLKADYTKGFGQRNFLSFGLVGGFSFEQATALNQISPINTFKPVSAEIYYLRSYLYGKIGCIVNNRVVINTIYGMQRLPQRRRPGNTGSGWHTGVSASYAGHQSTQNVALAYAEGDVIAGWGSPDNIRYIVDGTAALDDSSSFPTMQGFSKDGSSLITGAYWGNIDISRLRIKYGVWASNHHPRKEDIWEQNLNFINYQNDSTGAIREAYANAGLPAPDSLVFLEAQSYTDAKFSVVPVIHCFGPVHAGARYDYLHFHNPDAHTNMQALAVDQAMHPVTISGSDSGGILVAPLRWELEAVSASIISPFISVEYPTVGGLTIAYSQGFYDMPIARQGKVSNKHGNFSINAHVNYLLKTGFR
jgi:hypothetical protein